VAAADPQATPTIPRGTRFRPALLWSYAVSTGLYVITALITFILAAILGPQEFGLLWMAMVWVTLAQILLQHGPTIAVIQQEDITDDHLDAAFWTTVAGATGFAVLLAAAAPLWAAFNQLPELTALCLALTPIVPLYALNAIPEAVLRRRMQLRGIALRYLVSGLLSGVAAIGTALAGLGVWALVIQQVTMTATNTVLLWLMISWRPRFRRFGAQWRDIRATSFKTLAGAVGTFVHMRADVLVMGAYFGPVVVGVFRFALRVPELVMGLAGRGLHDVALPDLARHSLDRRALAGRLARLVHLGAVLSFPALGVVAAAAEPFVLLIGEQWTEAVTPLRLLCLAIAFTLLNSMFGPALQAAQRPGLPALMTWVNAACLVGGIYVAARLAAGASTADQVVAVAWAVIAVYAVLALTLGYLVFGRVLRVSPWSTVRAMLPSVLAGGAAAGSGMVVPAVVAGELPTLSWLALTVTVAGLLAAGVLLTVDGQVRRWLRQVGGRPGRQTGSGGR
jgi:O-antigen/teichoic acid export membrane protein